LQDERARIMAFTLKQEGLMKRFEGFWRVEPFPGSIGADGKPTVRP
jgi:hypothetical protein